MASQTDAGPIARLSLHDPNNFSIQLAQTAHRLALLQQWRFSAGANVIEIGCGQGDCTTVLATAVGERGQVTAIDPADLDYGAPYTLGQAQNHISNGPLGGRITWVQQSPLEYLSSLSVVSSRDALKEPKDGEDKIFDAAVLAHCLWYFSSPAHILSTFRALRRHSKRLLLAEWSLLATQAAAQPHVLAALAQAALECHKAESVSNVRTVLSPKRLAELAVAAGWQLESERCIPSTDGLLDGAWEVSACLAPSFEAQIKAHVTDEREQGVVLALRDACQASLESVQGGLKGVRSMDVWVATFV